MIWGYALVWAGQLLKDDPDPWLARLKLLKRYGLKTTGIGVGELEKMSDVTAGRLFDAVAALDVALTLIPHADYCNPDESEARRSIDHAISLVRRFAPKVRAPICHFGVATLHRFLAEPTLEWQMDRLARVLPPIVQACREAGAPLGIENHGDYYTSDLVELCERVPGLGIFLDTGNCFLVGERPLEASIAAAPYVIGGHWKDHLVRPVAREGPLRFEVGAAVIGQGHVPLREIYRELRARTPGFEKVVMEIELIPPSFKGDDPLTAFEQSVAFCKSLSQET